ncbi:MAG: ribonuclease E/G, partial [Xanthomonadales bacterium]|nr:ribonuclease E/G [Xanthomonadales bacterium]
MSEEILINITATESRVAVVEQGLLQEVYLDRSSHRGYVGNVYVGRVVRVLPGMQAAFVDIGLERTAFLHASDAVRSHWAAQEAATGTAPEHPNRELPPIKALVREKEKITVQVVKDPMGSKGARITTQLSIPSRFLVLLPGAGTIGVSARIEDNTERERLISMIEQLDQSNGRQGYIVRTKAEGAETFALAADMTYLQRVWEKLQERQGRADVGECVYEDLTLPLRALRDLMHRDIDRVRIDDVAVHQQVRDFVGRFVPEWEGRVEHHESSRPIFDFHGIEDEIEQALSRKAWLKSGGYLVIDQTEAMTTIDVNTGA